MEFKAIITSSEELDERTVKGYASVTGNVDSGGDRIFHGAFRKTLKENSDRVRHLWQHDFFSPPIASLVSLKEVSAADLPDEMMEKYPQVTGALEVVRKYLDTVRGNEVLAAIRSKAIKEMSFGYDPVKFDFEEENTGEDPNKRKRLIRNLRELRLWDTSDVNWGMNPLTRANEKSAVPYQDHGTADEDESWSGPSMEDFTDQMMEDCSGSEKRRIMNHFAWSENTPPEAYGDLKLPHHKAGKTGVGPAVWSGVKAAMGALMGARGGTKIPDGDRRAVYNHLAKHYEQFDKEPPEFKTVELMSWSTDFLSDQERSELIVVRKLDAQEMKQVFKLLTEMQEMLLSAEPLPEEIPPGTQALTEKVMRRLSIAGRNPILFDQ